ncbi:MAG: DUF72 domain-containing protein [Actinomycetota bacterium]|nr:DUF72 domain-containing protein [Actinomycetota bacterium]
MYAESFDTVEINATFYRLPRESSRLKWCNRLIGVPRLRRR